MDSVVGVNSMVGCIRSTSFQWNNYGTNTFYMKLKYPEIFFAFDILSSIILKAVFKHLPMIFIPSVVGRILGWP